MKGFKVCKLSGLLVEDEVKECPKTGSKDFVSKHKGIVVIINEKTKLKEVCEKSEIGIYAILY